MTPKPSVKQISQFPVTENDPLVTSRIRETFRGFFGEPAMGLEMLADSEDFSNLARTKGVPYGFKFFGGTHAVRWDDAAINRNLDFFIESY